MTDAVLTVEQIENIRLHYTGIEGDAYADGLTVWTVRKLCDLALRRAVPEALRALAQTVIDEEVTQDRKYRPTRELELARYILLAAAPASGEK